MRKAVFLDRDGVINIDGSYVYKAEDFHFNEGIFDFCIAAMEKDYLLVMVTNQSGIARGYYSEEDFLELTDWMCRRFAEYGVRLSGIYYCPFHPEKGVGIYKKDSADRKPQPGMIFRACRELDIDPAVSIMIGDRDSDMESGRRAHLGKLILMPEKYKYSVSDDVIVVHSLKEAAHHL